MAKPRLMNRTEQIMQVGTLETYNPQGQLVQTLPNDQIGYELKISNVGALIQGDKKTPNPWSYRIEQNRFLNGTAEMVYNGALQRKTGVYSSTHLNVPPWDRTACYNKCVDKFYELCRGGLDLSVDLAEAGQAAKMLRSTSKLLGLVRSIPELGPLINRATRQAQDGRLGRESAISIGKEIGDRWLEYQYGWKPLLNSIYGAADESLRVVLNKIQNFRATVRLPMSEPAGQWIHEIYIPGEDRYNVIRKQSCDISIEMEVPSWDPARWSSLNPASIAWELMPYSFVVDWVYDIGGCLRRMESALLYSKRFKRGYVSELYNYFGAYQHEGNWDTNLSGLVVQGRLSAYARKVEFQRSIFTSVPAGNLPTIRAELGSSRLLSAAALLSQFIRPGGKVFK